MPGVHLLTDQGQLCTWNINYTSNLCTLEEIKGILNSGRNVFGQKKNNDIGLISMDKNNWTKRPRRWYISGRKNLPEEI